MAQPAPARSNRRNLILVLGAPLAGVAVLATLFALASSGWSDEAGLGGGAAYRGSEPPARYTLPEFDFPSYEDGRASSHELRGRVVLLTLLDSQCTEACPILASVIARTVDRLDAEERKDVGAIAVSGDPAEDTRASVRRFLAARRAEGRLDYLVGEERELARCGRRCTCSRRSIPVATRCTRRRFGSTTAMASGSRRCTPAST